MSHKYELIGSGLFLLAVWVIFYVRRSKTPDPREKENEREFDEKVHFMEDWEPTWRKKKVE